jgi:hypothetical protein
MTSLEHVQALMEELGPSMPEIEAVAQEGDAAWAVAFPDENIVVIELDPTERKLVLAIDVGRPSEDAKLAAYEMALSYGYLWRETGGARFALGGLDGELTLHFDLEIAELTLPDFQMVLQSLVEKARIWRGFLEGGREASSSQEVGLRI